MMSDFLMREEFEAAIISEFKSAGLGDGPDLRRSENNEDYLNQVVGGAWWAWNVSRECLVIELPADAHLSRDGLDEHYLAGDMRDQIVESIHAAGVKTK